MCFFCTLQQGVWAERVKPVDTPKELDVLIQKLKSCVKDRYGQASIPRFFYSFSNMVLCYYSMDSKAELGPASPGRECVWSRCVLQCTHPPEHTLKLSSSDSKRFLVFLCVRGTCPSYSPGFRGEQSQGKKE